MQQRQPRLGDIVDDYCPRERRLTNHAVVAMIGEDIRLTRCTTCDAEHDYKHARQPRLKKKDEGLPVHPASLAAPRRIQAEPPPGAPAGQPDVVPVPLAAVALARPDLDVPAEAHELRLATPAEAASVGPVAVEDGPVHRQLIRAQLPKHEGQAPASRHQAPEFTIRQPGGRPGRFARGHRGGPPVLPHGHRGQGHGRPGGRPRSK